MGIELELAVPLAIAVIGPSTLAPFEVETPPWRKILKWAVVVALTVAVHRVAGHWALALPLGIGSLGVAVHFWWCRRNGIDPLRATPRRKYYELRGWRWPD